MGLEIDIEKIAEILLADGWHKVSPVGDGRSSFGIGGFELLAPPPEQEDSAPQQSEGGKEKPASPAGARWTEPDGSRVFCPITSILAVKYAGQKKSQ